MKKQHKILLIFTISVLSTAFIYYLFHGGLALYCDDAYIRAHIVEVAPRVKGHLISVLVKNNQYVKKDQLLMRIDPTPYQLQLNVEKATLQQQRTQLEIVTTKLNMVEKELKNIQNQYSLMLKKKERFETLSKNGAVSRQDYENVLTALDSVSNQLEEAEESCQYWRDSMAVQSTVIDSTQSKVALAEYVLSQTDVKAPASGFIVNINARPGDFAAQGIAMFGILEDDEWWVKANYKEYMLRKIKPGQKVWITTALYPWMIFEGEVVNIGRAISRSPDQEKIVPYVQPTTDWIRLERRFQVRIKFVDLSKDVRLHMGADARTFIWL